MNCRIMVVDDDASVRSTLSRVLQRFGHKVAEASGGEEALGLLEGDPPDVILIDLRMPVMSGRTLFHSIVSRWPELRNRIAVMSGDPEAEDQATWIETEQVPVIPKPFEVVDLMALIEGLARGRRLRANG